MFPFCHNSVSSSFDFSHSNTPFNVGVNAMMLAASNNHRDVVSLLLDAGVPWNALDKQNMACGDYAAKNNHVDLYERLVDAGCRYVHDRV